MSDQITVESINYVGSIRQQLLGCKSEKDVEAVFSKADINDFMARTEFLHIAMQIKKVYGTSDGTEPDPQEIYEYYKQFFINEKWKDFI